MKMEERKPLILIIYQGKAATVFRKHVVEKVTGAGAVPDEVEFSRSPTDRNILQLYDEKVRIADGALAIVVPDPRVASIAGNGWLEIGYWCKAKTRNTILVCLQKAPKDYDEAKNGPWPVKMISDLEGPPAPRFREAKDLDVHIERLVNNIRENLNPYAPGATHDAKGVYNRDLKVKDAILKGKPGLPPSDLQKCQERKDEPNCSYREQTTGLIAELLRIGRFNREQAVVESCLYRIVKYNKQALATNDQKELRESERHRRRQELIKEVRKVLEEICEAGAGLLVRDESHSEDALAQDRDAWSRIRDFLGYRYCVYKANEAKNSGKDKQDIDKDIVLCKTEVARFCDWAKKVASEAYKRTQFYTWGYTEFGKQDDDANELFTYGVQFAAEMGNVLTEQGRSYYGECTQVIDSNLSDAAKRVDIREIFKKIQDGFPHNKRESDLPRPWPRDEADKKKYEYA